jgi:hypothetical protein
MVSGAQIQMTWQAMDIASSRHADFPQIPAVDQDQVSGRPVLRGLQRRCLWLLAAVSPFVFIEPSPYEFAFLVVLVIFIGTGLRFAPAAMSLVAILAILNLGYTIGAINLFEKQEVLYWILTSWYLALTAIFFALVLSENTEERLDALLRGYRFAAVVVSLLAIAGYFNLTPGAQEQLTLYSRARGTFKDPNVLGGFLILPAIYCLQKVIDETARRAIGNAAAFAIINLAVLLSFSRAAWGILAVTALVSVALNFLTTNLARKKLRILILVMLAAGVAAAMLSVLLSFDAFANIFKERASLVQSYDAGRFGRFGRHILGAEMALDYPFGIGPLQFSRFFPEDTHNSFLNAFMSGGWLSGVTYPLLIGVTLLLSVRSQFVAAPWSQASKVLFVTFVGLAAESLIIDTDHWRHFFLLIGAVWGVSIASSRLAHTTEVVQADAAGELSWTSVVVQKFAPSSPRVHRANF